MNRRMVGFLPDRADPGRLSYGTHRSSPNRGGCRRTPGAGVSAGLCRCHLCRTPDLRTLRYGSATQSCASVVFERDQIPHAGPGRGPDRTRRRGVRGSRHPLRCRPAFGHLRARRRRRGCLHREGIRQPRGQDLLVRMGRSGVAGCDSGWRRSHRDQFRLLTCVLARRRQGQRGCRSFMSPTPPDWPGGDFRDGTYGTGPDSARAVQFEREVVSRSVPGRRKRLEFLGSRLHTA